MRRNEMASQERARTKNGLVRKLGIIGVVASLTLAACGTALTGTVQTTADRQSVLSDPDNPYWSRNTVISEPGVQLSTLGDPDNPYWSRNRATVAANDTVDQPHPRPY
jgi:hypothetical protein